MSNAGDEPEASQTTATTGASGAGAGEMAQGSVQTLDRSGADGVFVVTVRAMRCGIKQVGPAELPQRTKGDFCLLDVAAENAGHEARLFDGGLQRAVDSQGRSYPVSDRATVFLNDQSPTLLDEIAPGATVRGVLPFEVPAGTKLTALLLHESPGSKGARVALS